MKKLMFLVLIGCSVSLQMRADGIFMPQALTATGAIISCINANPDLRTAPSPIEVSCGIRAPLGFFGNFILYPGLEFYTIRYMLLDGKAYPATPEYADYSVTAFTVLTLPVLYRIDFRNGLDLSFGMGIVLQPGFSIMTYGTADTGAIGADINGNGEFLRPEIMTLFGWNFSERQAITAAIRGRYPLFTLISDGGTWYDRLIWSMEVGIRFELGKPGSSKTETPVRENSGPDPRPASAP